MKKDGYKYQIETELNKIDFEITKIGQNEDWWDDEHWRIEYKYDSNLKFIICFIVDPQFEGQRKKGQGIYEIKATKQFPENWNDDKETIASLYMTKRKFNIKLKEFINDIIKFKKKSSC